LNLIGRLGDYSQLEGPNGQVVSSWPKGGEQCLEFIGPAGNPRLTAATRAAYAIRLRQRLISSFARKPMSTGSSIPRRKGISNYAEPGSASVTGSWQTGRRWKYGTPE